MGAPASDIMRSSFDSRCPESTLRYPKDSKGPNQCHKGLVRVLQVILDPGASAVAITQEMMNDRHMVASFRHGSEKVNSKTAPDVFHLPESTPSSMMGRRMGRTLTLTLHEPNSTRSAIGPHHIAGLLHDRLHSKHRHCPERGQNQNQRAHDVV